MIRRRRCQQTNGSGNTSCMNKMHPILNIMTALFRCIGKLYSSLRTQVYPLIMPKSLVCRLVKDKLQLDTLPHRIAFAQKGVVQRRSRNRKGALFTEIPDGSQGSSGNRQAAYRDAKPASEVC
ncbi:hypothetical protein [Sphingobacterium multivorum]|uniref:hypothetical protein n=1 Tax=Sphingobacterium multivorum TaxID=28454 RepID=UPI0011C04947|nr:hypothetical protein [Sphingobacterium multivorum]QQT46227.1 hypothetical protein I6J00_06065 [Sphingobacterium multivorum]